MPELRQQYGIDFRRTLAQMIEDNTDIDVQDHVFEAVGVEAHLGLVSFSRGNLAPRRGSLFALMGRRGSVPLVTVEEPVRIVALPMPLRWLREPQSWSVPDGASLLVAAGPRTHWFVDPQRLGGAEAECAGARRRFERRLSPECPRHGRFRRDLRCGRARRVRERLTSGRSSASSIHRRVSRWSSRS